MKLTQSFRCAISGIAAAINTERNFRIHLVATVYVLFFSTFYDFTRGEYILLIVLSAGVLAAELLNTAVEHVVNLMVQKYDLHAKIAKDTAAGGVLIMAAAAVTAGILLFWDIPAINRMFSDFLARPLFWGATLLGSLALSCLFIRGAKK
jgi:diacylglycerol kinase